MLWLISWANKAEGQGYSMLLSRIITGNGIISYHDILCYKVDNQVSGYQIFLKSVCVAGQDKKKDKEVTLMALT